ncbi:MAG: hypothetical protein ACYDB7_12415 [Mycobacteriales bacterium]
MRRLALVPVVALLAGLGLSACGSNNSDQQAVLAALDASLASARNFVFVDQDLVHRTTVTGEVADSFRYSMLLSLDGATQWQEVVRDNSVADLFSGPAALTRYAGAGSSPADDVLADYASLRPLLPAGIPTPNFSMLPRTQVVDPSLGLRALQAGKWVVDPTGAPTLPSIGNDSQQLLTDPFTEPLVFLAAVRQTIDLSPPYFVKLFRPASLTPTYKPGDDPFPPPGPGVKRYDVVEPALPTLSASSLGSKPAPPTNADFRKLAIYVQGGKVVAVREDYDTLDRLQKLARNYQIPLKLSAAAGPILEDRIGELITELVQPTAPVPFRVHEETMLLSYPATPPPITLPNPAVTASLSFIPGQGPPTTTATS